MLKEEYAPHVSEIAAAIDNKISEEEIATELAKYVEKFMVPMTEAKRSVIRKFGGKPRARGGSGGKKAIKDITVNDRFVDLLVQVISLDSKQITVKGEQKVIEVGVLADDTGTIEFSDWKGGRLAENAVVEILGASIRPFRDEPQVNINEKTKVNVKDDVSIELSVIPEPGEVVPVQRLINGLLNVNVEVRVLKVTSRPVNTADGPKDLFSGVLGDESGKIAFVAWDSFSGAAGDAIKIAGASVKVYRSMLQLNIHDFTEVQPLDNGAVPSVNEIREGQKVAVSDLRDGMVDVRCEVLILRLEEREVTVRETQKTVWSGECADESGSCSFTSWVDLGLEETKTYLIDGADVKEWRNTPSINLDAGAVATEVDSTLSADNVAIYKQMGLEEVSDLQAGLSIATAGTVIEVRDRSGLIYRCGESGCNKVLQNSACLVHGQQEGVADVRVKIILDDGKGAVTVIFNRPLTEKLLEMKLEEMRDTPEDVVLKAITGRLIGRRFKMEGRAIPGDMGVILLADTFERQAPSDVNSRVESLQSAWERGFQ